MLVSIRHTTHYTYDAVSSSAAQRLRLTPSDNQSQKVLSWAIEAPGIENAASYLDGFGNRIHLITHTRSYETLDITASGEVETYDCDGVVGFIGEVANPRIFLRPTPRTESSSAINALADEVRDQKPLDRLHHLLEAIATHVVYDTDATHAETSAAEAFAAGQGVCQDHAHIFIAATRRLGVPARYVTGYLLVEGEEKRSPIMPGRKPSSTISAGWASTRPTISARRSVMCGLPAASTRRRRRRSPGRGGAGEPNR